MEPFDIVTDAIAWLSLSVSTIRYYPQLYTNFKRKSVIGLDLSYVIFDVSSCIFATLFYTSLYHSSDIAAQYQNRFRRSHSPATWRDLIFSAHSLTMSIVQVIHIIIYQRGKQKVQWYCFVITAVAWLSVFGMFMLQESCVGNDCWLTFFMYFGVVIVALDFVRYLPQVWLNRYRRRTDGFASGFVWCSFVGNILWITHLGMICGSAGNLNEFTSNIATLVVVGITLLVDVVFIMQSTCCYPSDANTYSRMDSDTCSTLESDSYSMISSSSPMGHSHINSDHTRATIVNEYEYKYSGGAVHRVPLPSSLRHHDGDGHK